MTTDEPQGMSVARAARILGVSPPTLHKALDAGAIPHYRVMARRYVRTDVVEAILRDGEASQAASVA